MDRSEGASAVNSFTPGDMRGIPLEVSESLFFYTFYGMNNGVGVLYDTEDKAVIDIREVAVGHDAVFPLKFVNSNEIYYADKSCDLGEKPRQPDFGAPEGDLEAFTARIERLSNEFAKALEEWTAKATNPEYCEITIYSDKDKTKRLIHIPKASHAVVYNDRYAFIKRNFEAALYDLQSGDSVWSLDIDY